MTAVEEVSNPTINLNELYNGLVQIQYDHAEDTDDIVPELSDNVKIVMKKDKGVAKKTGFDGQEFEEFYDEWSFSENPPFIFKPNKFII